VLGEPGSDPTKHEDDGHENRVGRELDQPNAAREEHRSEPDPERGFRDTNGQLAREEHAGDRAEQQPAHRVQVDVPVNEVADARDPEQRRRVENVRTHDFGRRQWEHEQHHETEERAASDRCQTDEEPAARSEGDTDHAVTVREQERRVRRLDAALDERLREEAEPAEDERVADHLGHDVAHAAPVLVLDPVRELDAYQRHRRRAEKHPKRDPRMDGAKLAVSDGAERLEDGAVENVRAHRERRLESRRRGSGSASSTIPRPSRSDRRATRSVGP
jgi:hypothetical protein